MLFQVARYLDTPDIATGTITQIDPAIKQRLVRHLDSCVAELDLDLGSRPDSGLGSSPGSVTTDRVIGGPVSPNPLDSQQQQQQQQQPNTVATHCNAATLGIALIKQEIPELEAVAAAAAANTRPDGGSIAPGDENNNSSRPTSTFSQVHSTTQGMPGTMEQPGQPNQNMLSVVQVI